MFCDSNLELWYDKVEVLNLKVIFMPYEINNEEKIYDLGKTMNFTEFYNKIRAGAMPKTQALNPQNYIDYFEPYLKQGENILYLHFSKQLSGTFEYLAQAIKQLKQKYPKQTITTIDTLSISIGASGLLFEAAKLHNSGASDEEVVQFVLKNRNKYVAYFVVDDLNHLKRGGRIGSAKAFVGTMMNIKPILTINSSGAITSVDKANGKKKALLAMLEKVKQEGQNLLDHPIIVTHADAIDDAQFLENKLRDYLGEQANIWVQPIGPTIGTHCGPGTIGVSFYGKKRVD
jgi:DegV family protein with EDD domain